MTNFVKWFGTPEKVAAAGIYFDDYDNLIVSIDSEHPLGAFFECFDNREQFLEWLSAPAE